MWCLLEWACCERSVVDAAHPARMMVTDTVRSGARAKLGGGGAPVVNVGGCRAGASAFK